MKLAYIVSMLFSLSAFAGTEIKLNSGTINTKNREVLVQQNELNQKTEWLIQFKSPITEKLKQDLSRQGIVVFSYIPEDALLVRASAESALKLQGQVDVQAVVAFEPYMKLSPTLGRVSAATSAARETFIVSVFDQSERSIIENTIRKISKDILVQSSAARNIVVTTERRHLLAMAAVDGVEHIQAFVQVQPLHVILEETQEPPTQQPPQQEPKAPAGDYTDLNGYETGTKVMNFDVAWAAGLTGLGQIVGMGDTGLDSGNAGAIHTDFMGAVKSGYAVGMFGRSWADPMGHGTHVAGSVLGRGTASGGKLKGGAYEATMVVQGMWSPILNNLSVPSNLANMFTQAYNDGARLHTNSWGAAANFGAYEKMAATVDEVMFAKEDYLILFAAGNSGVDKNRDGRIDPNSIGTPGTAKNALTVGASENLLDVGGIQVPAGKLKSGPENWPVDPIASGKISDNVDGIAMFSSRGPTNDGRIKPDIVAPGTNILSVRSQEKTAVDMWGKYNDDYVYAGGTSMACPLTAASAAITRQMLIEKLGYTNPSAALLKAYLLHTATDMYPGQYGEVGASRGQEILTKRPNNDQGYGRVNVAQIVSLGQNGARLLADSRGVATGETETATMTISEAGHLVVNLVWTDAPGSANASKALVNDLDLEVVLPNGTVLAVNDQLNNHAFVQGETPAGEIQIRVKGINVPMGKSGKQPFALVASVQPR
ncbi:S8 family serine peptidase [Pseudobdellovibrio exovorus]|uniref:Subtilisin-like serine protease n=1 Tax=Pseudobdellovibrio exovorus JSS TaxID=1184267 RepID=M4VQ21_9BACT|nr:S8 family serine peptidase [Pseudobdellovibrio exovorus]AGH95244.1 subtilisin-like serine protease [Pseudobdellovibrio exovorus JSS]